LINIFTNNPPSTKEHQATHRDFADG